MSLGQQAYERDLAAVPRYYDGSIRPKWSELSEIAQWSWNRDPTDRFTTVARQEESLDETK